MHEAMTPVILKSVATVGNNIQRLRKAADISPANLARRMKVPPQRVSDWEKDRYRSPDISSMMALARALDCKVDDLLVGLDEAYDEHIQQKTGTERVDHASTQEVVSDVVAAPSRPSIHPDIVASITATIEDVKNQLDDLTDHVLTRGAGLPDPTEAQHSVSLRKDRRAPQRRRRGRR